MNKTVTYQGYANRNKLIKDNEALGLRMITDTFSPDWKPGDPPGGTMIFTDAKPPESPPIVDYKKEYAMAHGDVEKIDVIARKLGLK